MKAEDGSNLGSPVQAALQGYQRGVAYPQEHDTLVSSAGSTEAIRATRLRRRHDLSIHSNRGAR